MNLLKVITALRKNPFLNHLIKPINDIWRKRFEKQVTKHPYRRFAHDHKLFYGLKANLDNPRTLHEKIYWMAYCTDISLWQKLTDKVSVREWIKEKGLGKYLNKEYIIWHNPPSFDVFLKEIPNRCVIKTNHAGGGSGVYIIRDKDSTDLHNIYLNILKDISINYGIKTGQPHYIGIPPKIMVEKFLENPSDNYHSLPDFKFICINGEPRYINLVFNRDFKDRKYIRQIFDIAWNRIKIDNDDVTPSFTKPKSFDEMLFIAKLLSKGFPFVRVDLYEVDNKPIFGEMTFTPGFNTFYGGYGNKVLKLGELCDISDQKQIYPIRHEYY